MWLRRGQLCWRSVPKKTHDTFLMRKVVRDHRWGEMEVCETWSLSSSKYSSCPADAVFLGWLLLSSNFFFSSEIFLAQMFKQWVNWYYKNNELFSLSLSVYFSMRGACMCHGLHVQLRGHVGVISSSFSDVVQMIKHGPLGLEWVPLLTEPP